MSKDKNIEEQTLEQYVAAHENNNQQQEVIKSDNMIGNGIVSDEISNPKAFDRYKSAASNQEARELHKADMVATQEELGMGFINVPVDTLPSEGMFYPQGTKFMIRAANAGEIKHWSTIEEDNTNDVDDHLNYILEHCLRVKMPGIPNASWKDLKEIDRFYLILSIRDFTFTDGSNELQLKINENTYMPLKKDNIDFLEWNPKLLKYYNDVDRCFTFPTKNKKIEKINVYVPCLGVGNWLKTYGQRKQQQKQGFDMDFMSIAPLLLRDYRGLNDMAYQSFVESCQDFGPYEWSLITHVRDLMQDSIDAKFKYIDDGGVEQEAPITFLKGGLKGLFLYDFDNLL